MQTQSKLWEGGVAPPTREVSFVIVLEVWQNGTDVIVLVLVALFVEFWWASSGLSNFHGCPCETGWV